MTYETLLNKLLIDLQNIGVLRGRRGEIGPQGIPGVQGKQGIQGKTGVTFTPHLSYDGELSWTNDGSLVNPPTINIRGPRGLRGETGLEGKPGTGLVIKGTYSSLSDLVASVVSPSQGDIYNVGTSAPYKLYMWDEYSSDWIDMGQLQGVKGATGEQGDRYNLTYTWSEGTYSLILFKNGIKMSSTSILYYYLSYNPEVSPGFGISYNGEITSPNGEFSISTNAPLARVEIFDDSGSVLLYSGIINRLYRGDEYSYGYSSESNGFVIKFFKNGLLDSNTKYLKIFKSLDGNVLANSGDASVEYQLLTVSSYELDIDSVSPIYSLYIEVYSDELTSDFQQSIFISRPYRGPQGIQGEKGDTGEPIRILGIYSSLSDLLNSGIEFSQGDMYLVGTSPQFVVYMWDTTVSPNFISLGEIRGPKGDQGSPGESLFFCSSSSSPTTLDKVVTSLGNNLSLNDGTTLVIGFEFDHNASAGRPNLLVDSNTAVPLYLYGSDSIPFWGPGSLFVVVYDATLSRFIANSQYATTELAGPVKLSTTRSSDKSTVPTSSLLNSLVASLESSINSILNPNFTFVDDVSGNSINYTKSYQNMIRNLIELELYGSHVDGIIQPTDWDNYQVTISNSLLSYYDAVLSLAPNATPEEKKAASFASIEIISDSDGAVVVSCANGVQPTIPIPYRLTFLFRFRSN